MQVKPSIPKGTRDFATEAIHHRDYIFNTIKEVFKLYGYQPIETPAMENLTTLLEKYGDEGDRLVFRILNSGDFISKYQEKDKKLLQEQWDHLLSIIEKPNISFSDFKTIINSYQQKDDKISNLLYNYFKGCLSQIELYSRSKKITNGLNFRKYLDRYRYPHLIKRLEDFIMKNAQLMKGISDKGLRYDLTVPFARYVVQHQSEIQFPFKRFQIQPVWRGENPQKGRYREFYQCDVDIIGSKSLLNELELIRIIDDVFTSLNIETIVKINNRKILTGIAEYIGAPDKITDITVAIDKIEKDGLDSVIQELINNGLSDNAIQRLTPILQMKGDNKTKLLNLETILENFESGRRGITELNDLLELLKKISLSTKIQFDLTLARGLNYYTGAIIEVKAKGVEIGSICGGGRYDDLTGIFGLKGMSGVGISFGADRIYDVLSSLNRLKSNMVIGTKFLIYNAGEKYLNRNLKINDELHKSGYSSEIYPDSKEYNKQIEYARTKKIPYVIIIKDAELVADKITLLDMSSKEKKIIAFDEIKSSIFSDILK
jgi:histidyl-tRNA synthetase